MDNRNAAVSLAAMKSDVEAELGRLLAGGTGLHEGLRYAVLGGGKRFRPLLLLSSGEAFGGGRKTLLPFACAIELIHCYSLVHDDLPCMDDDAVRRGKPSTHKAFGEARALLVGDGLLTLAFEIMAGAPAGAAGADRKDLSVREIAGAAGIKGMIAGQWLDIGYDEEGANTASFLDLVSLKTGALILASIRAGALMGGAPESIMPEMDRFGRSVGLAFQLRDDLHDAGKETEAGAGTRPNAAVLFGPDGAGTRLGGAVTEALGALDAAGVESAELRALALSLRVPE